MKLLVTQIYRFLIGPLAGVRSAAAGGPVSCKCENQWYNRARKQQGVDACSCHRITPKESPSSLYTSCLPEKITFREFFSVFDDRRTQPLLSGVVAVIGADADADNNAGKHQERRASVIRHSPRSVM